MSFYKKIVGEDYFNLFGDLEIMSMPSTHEEDIIIDENNEINFDITIDNEQTDEVNINNGMEDAEQFYEHDKFLSFFNLNNNINNNNNELDELDELDNNLSETDSIDDEYLTKNNENSESDVNNSKGKQTT